MSTGVDINFDSGVEIHRAGDQEVVAIDDSLG